MTTTRGYHWFQRCGTAARDWLLSNPGEALTTTALDAVIGAGGVPVRGPGESQSEAYYLHPADSSYLVELRAAGLSR